jgi:hypothetical protein
MVTPVLRDERVLLAFVVVVAIAASAFIVLFLGGGTTELLYALGGGAVLSAVLVGVYAFGSRSGHPHSHAVAEAAVVLGVLYLGLLVHRLLTEFGVFSAGEALLAVAAALAALLVFVGAIGLLGRVGTAS